MPKNSHDIDAQLASLEQKIAAERAKFVEAAQRHVAETLSRLGLSLADLGLSAAIHAPAPKRAGRPKKVAEPIEVKPLRAVKKRKPAFKGPQPPRYQDPESGATWSGFGRAPSWIASANRDDFLIQEAA